MEWRTFLKFDELKKFSDTFFVKIVLPDFTQIRMIGGIVLAGGLLSPIAFAQLDTNRSLPGVDDGWVRMESPNFEVYSDNTEREAREIIHDLEVLRAVFFDEMQMVEKHRVEVTVYAFSSSSEYQAYARSSADDRKETAGLYLSRPDRAVIVLRPMQNREQARRVVFHEYVHHLFRAVGEDPPLWFNEGLAELFGGIQIDRDTVTIGHPLVDRLIGLQRTDLLPLDELFNVGFDSKHYQSNDHAGLFYAQSWALLHYWKFGNSKIPDEAVNRFIAVAGRRKALAETNIQSLFEACFDMDYAAMEKQLRRYVRRGRYTYGKVPMPDIPDKSTYAVTAVSAADIQIRLAELAVRMRGDVMGQLVLMQLGEAAGADPRIFETLGGDAAGRGDRDRAMDYWRRAAELGSNNSSVLRELAREDWNKWFSDYSPTFRLPAEEADKMRAWLVASIRAEPNQDEAYQMLAWVEGFVDEPRSGNINAVQGRFQMMEDKARTLLALAVSRDRLGHRDRAIEVIKEIGRFDPDAWTLGAAERTLAHWEGKAPNEVFLGAADDSVRQGVRRLTQNIRRLPSVPVPEDLGD